MLPAATAGGRGAWYGFAAYALWGLLPLYLTLLTPSGPWEILAHRILWSLLLCLVLLALTGQARGLVALARRPRDAAGIAVAGLLIATNWIVYVSAVLGGHVTDAALGYFLNPLVSVALGLVVLRERLRRGQAVAVAVGAAGGGFLALSTGGVPWIALTLALSFGLYGLLKNVLGARLGALESLTCETAVLAPFAAGTLALLAARGETTFGAAGTVHAALLVSTGVTTAVPLLLFAAAARRVPLVTIGLLQFVAPILQFLTGLALGEAMSPARWIGFAIVWAACGLLAVDSVRVARLRRPPRRAAAGRVRVVPTRPRSAPSRPAGSSS